MRRTLSRRHIPVCMIVLKRYLVSYFLDLSQAQVRLDLYRQDAASIQCGAVSVMGSEDTPSTIVSVGLDLEEEQ